MTTQVAIAYPEGLVIASDLLGINPKNGHRTESKKLYYKNGIVIGYSGSEQSGGDRPLESMVFHLLLRYSVAQLLGRQLAKFNSRMNIFMKIRYLDVSNHLSSLVGAYFSQEFNLYQDSGNGNPLWGNKIKPIFVNDPEAENDLVKVVIGTGNVDVSDFISAAESARSSAQALEWAIFTVRAINQRHPEKFSGLDAIQMTKDFTSRVVYEPILK